ncbi:MULTISPECIES: TonB-dependent receptor domain-containing protein [unclassified Arcicella]|uniref:TonB-dependent receptor n=1 Tax=unclassified Arcicella TaxID=2644986 RepID=UPI002866757C|nr:MULTISPECIES: TonB-dependent receptor [unclassified Arcicella]MDR6564756.1 outer membrane receptor protein involved in Fe transport [Arcicella sp. BE51]MDR6814552.1 outer membrane receptor protein involved in Fe transport [Arcicella sp. BE140]MDR6825860.1 outer membrane receptor protein involved in Fe transport [Arcicella sp. BE139]
MKNYFTTIRLGLVTSLLFLTSMLFAQTKISGKISDGSTKEPLIGVSISVKGRVIGTISDTKGSFSLTTSTPTPFTVIVSSVGYNTQEFIVDGSKSNYDITLSEQVIMGQEVVISASRVEQSIMKSPVSIEKMDIRAIQNTPSVSFYDALKNLKGVEVSTQSLTFSSVNTRGFNANGNVRMVQLIDGMDNQAPGLNFSVGNIVGISELDLESAELLPGAASALYGPNALNGILLMNSKSPFLYQGLSASVKTGVMNESSRSVATTGYYDASIRYAKAFNNKFAFKANFSYLKADDWQANDFRDQSFLNGSNFNGTRDNNLAYNGVNTYGDETNVNMYSGLLGNGTPGNGANGTSAILGAIATFVYPANIPGIGGKSLLQLTGQSPKQIFDAIIPGQTTSNISRIGYNENDLASYGTTSLKLNGALHYRINDNVEAIAQASWGNGTTLYTGADRYSIKNFSLGQYKLEIKGSNFFVRAYTTQERSGDAYATGTLGSLVNEAWKPSTTWYPQYFGTFAQTALTNYATIFAGALGQGLAPAAAMTAAAASTQSQFGAYHTAARTLADAGRLTPASPSWNTTLDNVKSQPIPRGAKFNDKSNLYAIEGMYNLSQAFNNVVDVIVGANYRTYSLNSGGTLFATQEANADGSSNPNAKEFTISEFGAYTQLAKDLFDKKFRLSGSLRYDKNENFAGQFTPRVSGVFSPTNNHNFRLSYQTGFRIPTTQDQYIDLLTPQARLIGGLPLFDTRYQLSGKSYIYQSVLANPTDPTKWQVYNRKEYKPERVASWEIGYKGLVAQKLFVDAYYYTSTFTNFSISQVVVKPDPAIAGRVQPYSLPTNADNDVKTEGWAIGLDYALPGGFNIGGNVSHNVLSNDGGLTSGQLQYNTPAYRYNFSLGNRNIAKTGLGFNVVWRYQESFIWQSSFVSPAVNTLQAGNIPAFSTLDAQVSKKVASIKSIIKLGGTNILGKSYVTSWGNPTVGSMFYIGIAFDELLNK